MDFPIDDRATGLAVIQHLQARAAAILPGPRTPSEVASHGLPDAIIALRAPD